jgi:hypothetical protein
MLLSACTPRTLTEVRIERLDIPPSLLVRVDPPAKPDLVTQKSVAEWGVLLYERLDVCNANLTTIEAIVNSAGGEDAGR